MDDMTHHVDADTKEVITKLIDFWNVGIKRGYIDNGCEEEVVKKYLKSVGIIVCLDYEYIPRTDSGKTKFIMVKVSDSDNIRNPVEDF